MRHAAGASLLFVNQHYTPDVAATGQCLADLAEHLVRDGYDVEVLAGRTPNGANPGSAPAREVLNGVRVHRVSTTIVRLPADHIRAILAAACHSSVPTGTATLPGSVAVPMCEM